MPRYKRSANEAELDLSALDVGPPANTEQHGTLQKLRNMWEFASLMQFIYIFGSVVRIDEDFDIEDLEHECLLPQPSAKIADIGLTLLKYVSSHRGLTHDIFAEYTRRQYLAKAPERNPFGDDDDPMPFDDLDIYTRIRILQQLSTWTFTNADRMRGLMPEDDDHLDWRIEPLGWDADDRAYFVLDDNRLYRRTDELIPPPTPPAPKAKSKSKSKSKSKVTPNRATRASKRIKLDDSDDDEEDDSPVEQEVNGHVDEKNGYGFTDTTWECVAITLEEYQDFLATIRRSRDPNEKTLRNRIESEVLPIIEKRAEAIRAKELKKLRELENLQKMATAKRSSRIADKADRAAKEQEERNAEEKRAADLRMAREEQDRQRRIEEGHESRRLTREQRLKEREVKRILHEEELTRLEQEASAEPTQSGDEVNGERVRLSSRNLQNQKEAHRKELDRLQHDQQEDKWYFDCVLCGMHGENLDDGSHSVACERCNVWQHSKCHGYTPEQCEDENFHFVCRSCRRKERAEEAAKEEQRSGLTIKLSKRPTESPKSTVPPAVKAEFHQQESAQAPTTTVKKDAVLPDYIQRQLAQMNSTQTYRPPSAQMYIDPPRPPQQQWPNLPRPQQGNPPLGYYHPASQDPLQHTQHRGHIDQHSSIHNKAVNGSPGHNFHRQPPVNGAQQSFNASPPPRNVNQAPFNIIANQNYNGQQSITRQGYPPSVSQSYASQPPVVSQGHDQTRPTPSVQSPQTQSMNEASTMQTPQVARDLYGQKALQTPQIARDTSQIHSSPHSNIPPPSTNYNRQAAISPEKSSPPRAPAVIMTNGHYAGSQLNVERATPNSSFDNAPKLTTPIKTTASPVPLERTSDSLAASGMRGPWPDGSMSVPKKADAIPSPPQD